MRSRTGPVAEPLNGMRATLERIKAKAHQIRVAIGVLRQAGVWPQLPNLHPSHAPHSRQTRLRIALSAFDLRE